MINAFVCLILSICSLQFVFAQNKTYEAQDSLIKALYNEGSTKEVGIEVLYYIHYESVEASKLPKCAVFYYDELGTYMIKTSQLWELKNSSEIVLNLLQNVSDWKLITELKFRQMDAEWLKKQLLLNSDENLANFIYYNEMDSLGYFRTYELISRQK